MVFLESHENSHADEFCITQWHKLGKRAFTVAPSASSNTNPIQNLPSKGNW
jgi:hypothetical protein